MIPRRGGVSHLLGAFILGEFFGCPPPRGIKLGDVYFLKMLELSLGVACGAKRFEYFTSEMSFLLFLRSRDIKLGDVYFIKMFAFVVGVACGAQQFLYFTPNMTFSRYF